MCNGQLLLKVKGGRFGQPMNQGSKVKGEVDTLPSFNTDQLSLLL